MTPEVLQTEDVGAVRVITLNRPQRMNAIDVDLACALRDAVQEACGQADVRALVITGAGGNFCTGGDIRRDREREKACNIDLLDVVHEVFLALRNGDKPSVAAVQGHARGAGLALMLACDFAIADETARFAAQFTAMGLVPDLGLCMTLPERVGMAMARDMVLCGTEKDAGAALSARLVDQLCPAGNARAAALDKAAAIARQAPLATAAARRLLHTTREAVDLVLREESRLQNALRQTQDAHEAIAAFSEKRKPVFRGR